MLKKYVFSSLSRVTNIDIKRILEDTLIENAHRGSEFLNFLMIFCPLMISEFIEMNENCENEIYIIFDKSENYIYFAKFYNDDIYNMPIYLDRKWAKPVLPECCEDVFNILVDVLLNKCLTQQNVEVNRF